MQNEVEKSGIDPAENHIISLALGNYWRQVRSIIAFRRVVGHLEERITIGGSFKVEFFLRQLAVPAVYQGFCGTPKGMLRPRSGHPRRLAAFYDAHHQGALRLLSTVTVGKSTRCVAQAFAVLMSGMNG